MQIEVTVVYMTTNLLIFSTVLFFSFRCSFRERTDGKGDTEHGQLCSGGNPSF